MADPRHVAIFSWMGAGQNDHRGVGARIRRRKEPPTRSGGFDAEVFFVSEQRGSSHRRHEEGRVDYPQPCKRFQRATDGQGASLVTASTAAHGQEAPTVAALASLTYAAGLFGITRRDELNGVAGNIESASVWKTR